MALVLNPIHPMVDDLHKRFPIEPNYKAEIGKQHWDDRVEGKKELSDEDVSTEIKKKWQIEVKELKKKLVLKDAESVKEMLNIPCDQDEEEEDSEPQFYVGGVDISFVKGDLVNACAALIVLSYPQLEVVYKDLRMIKLTAPYIPGYLGFRESGFAVELMDTLKKTKPELVPHVMMVDGNGILHDDDFGSACHIGVALDMPCIGVAKSLFHTQGIEKNEHHKQEIDAMLKSGETFKLKTDTGKILGLALLTGYKSKNPVYVSPGNHISVESAAKLVHRCSLHRIPEPIRQADMLSREYLRNNFPPSVQAS